MTAMTISELERIRKARPLTPSERGKLGALRKAAKREAREATRDTRPGEAPRVQIGKSLISRGRPAVSIMGPTGRRAVVSPVGRPRDGRFYRLAFSLTIDTKRVGEYVYKNWKDANAAHDALVTALREFAGADE